MKLTDSGRTVYGGGGITPDVKIAPVKSNHFQDSLLQHYAFFNFAKHYAITHHPAKSFEVDDAVLQDFRKFLDEEKVPFTEAELIGTMTGCAPTSRAKSSSMPSARKKA